MKKTHSGAIKEMSSNMAKTARKYRYEFYRDNFRLMVTAALGLVVFDVLLVVAMFVTFSTQPASDVYATTRSGLLVKLQPTESLAALKAANARKTPIKIESANP